MTAVEAPRIYPTFRYRDAVAMIDWLGQAFGFTVRAKYMDGEKVGHAELAFGSSIIMLGSVRDDDYGRMVGEPGSSSGGKSTYVAVDDADALFAQGQSSWSQDPGRPDRPGLWQPRIHLRRSGRQYLELWHLLAEGRRGGIAWPVATAPLPADRVAVEVAFPARRRSRPARARRSRGGRAAARARRAFRGTARESRLPRTARADRCRTPCRRPTSAPSATPSIVTAGRSSVRPGRAAEMDFVAGQAASSNAASAPVDVAHRLFRRHDGFDIEQAKTFGLASRCLRCHRDRARCVPASGSRRRCRRRDRRAGDAPRGRGPSHWRENARGRRWSTLEPGRTTSAASSGRRSPGGTKTTSTSGSALQRVEIVEIGDAAKHRHGDLSAPPLARRQPLQHDGILGRQPRRRLQPGHDAEAGPAGEPLDRGNARHRTARRRRGTC